MALTDNLTSFSAILTKLPQQRIAQAISVLLLIYVAFMAAKITWLVVPQQSTAGNASAAKHIVQKSKTGKNINISALQSLNLFGQYNEQIKEEAVEQVTDAPETRLQLTLSGLVASDQVEIAAAIIENKGKQATYGIGDIIKGTRASLEQVLIDRVIIKQSGRLETLMLDGADYNQPAQSVSNKKASNKENSKASQQRESKNSPQRLAFEPKASVVDHRSNKELSINAKRLRSDLQNDPGKITDYLRISPARKEGKIVGYRLSPGKKPDFFKLSGLKSGDIAVQMNGHDLLVAMEAAQAMSALKTERDISLLVKRKDELIEILFSID
jgi:general secretion pathway protein C